MKLDHNINLFHWGVALPAWAIGLYALWHRSAPRADRGLGR